jgi:hypothetical protein
MSFDSLEHALVLVSQGKSREAQSLLKPLITADPHNVAAWFLFIETCPTDHLRLKVLEQCLAHNPDNLQVRESLEKLRASIEEQSTDSFTVKEEHVNKLLPADGKQSTNKIGSLDQGPNTSSMTVAENSLLVQKTRISKQFRWFVLLIAAIISSIAVRLLAPGYFLVFFGCLLLIPIGIHFAVHLFVILRADIDSPAFDKIILVSHLLLFFFFLTQVDMDDYNIGNAFTQILRAVGINVPRTIINFLPKLSIVFAVGLFLSWLAISLPWFHISREKRHA